MSSVVTPPPQIAASNPTRNSRRTDLNSGGNPGDESTTTSNPKRDQQKAASIDRNGRARPTRLGWHFGLIACFAVVGGSIRGFNLMLILAGLIFAALIMSWRVALRMIERTSVRRRLPIEAVAGQPFQIRYLWSNRGGTVPTWMMRVDDTMRPVTTGSDGTAARSAERLNRLTMGLLGATGGVTLRSGIAAVPASTAVVSGVEVRVPRRGCFEFGSMTVSTKFPVGLVEIRRRTNQDGRLFVYPRLMRLHSDWRRRLKLHPGGTTESARKSGQEEGEFYGIREWRHGDSPRWIHWRTTARLLEPAVRQFQQPRRPDMCIVLDAFGDESVATSAGGPSKPLSDLINGKDPVDANPDVQSLEDGVFEQAVSLTATLMLAVMGTTGDAATLGIASRSATWVADVRGRGGKQRCLRPLTEVDTCEHPALIDLIQRFIHSPSRPKELLVVSTRSRDQALLMDPGLGAALSPWLRRSKLVWLDVRHQLESVADPSFHRQSSQRQSSNRQFSERQPSPDSSPGRVKVP